MRETTATTTAKIITINSAVKTNAKFWRWQKKKSGTSHPSLGRSYELWNETRDMKRCPSLGYEQKMIYRNQHDVGKWPNRERSTTEMTLSLSLFILANASAFNFIHIRIDLFHMRSQFSHGYRMTRFHSKAITSNTARLKANFIMTDIYTCSDQCTMNNSIHPFSKRAHWAFACQNSSFSALLAILICIL